MNASLEYNILEEYILAMLSSLKKGKSPSPNGLIVEFYLGFYDLIKIGLLKMV
jgi:hypothetical protein